MAEDALEKCLSEVKKIKKFIILTGIAVYYN